MQDIRSVPSNARYRLTRHGVQGLLEATCPCERLELAGGKIECPECQTVYGLVRQIAMGRTVWALPK